MSRNRVHFDSAVTADELAFPKDDFRESRSFCTFSGHEAQLALIRGRHFVLSGVSYVGRGGRQSEQERGCGGVVPYCPRAAWIKADGDYPMELNPPTVESNP